MEGFFAFVVVILIIVLKTRAGVEAKKEADKKAAYNNSLEEKRKVYNQKIEADRPKLLQEFIDQLVDIIEQNKYGLLEKRRKLVKKDS